MSHGVSCEGVTGGAGRAGKGRPASRSLLLRRGGRDRCLFFLHVLPRQDRLVPRLRRHRGRSECTRRWTSWFGW